ncbi:hypothetical protein IFR23_19820 [Sphingomonas sp. CFBP 13603]|uniref:hypothetical protein n=1 Tax=Sphingomonas sp. CFBP 13603 TaxID=2774040 RepID=UPI001867BD8B|nr:hypothetical protein [Sphingomonas sp. CFBP 13603]MBE2994242.1 hypothetical protein [Sphingomonas sp. CFBP 13603]
MRIGLVACAGMVLLAGCSNPKKASEGNFEKAINAYLEKKPMCINAPTSTTKATGHDDDRTPYPAYVAMPTASAGQSNFEDRIRSFDALVKAGLASTSTGTIDTKGSWGSADEKLAVKIYNLTEDGKKAFVKSPDGNPYGSEFCYGTPVVDEVTQFTEPSDAFGAMFSSVAYTYHVKDQASWATNPAMIEAFPSLKQATGDKLEGKTTVVLTNNGWVDNRDRKF